MRVYLVLLIEGEDALKTSKPKRTPWTAIVVGLTASLLLALSPMMAGAEEPPALTGATRTAIEQLVRDYIIKNPEILLEAQAALEARTEQQRIHVIRKKLADNAEAIYRDVSLPMAGNPKGNVTVVEFMDYNCPYCRRASADIAKLIASDPNVKVVFHEFANLSAASEAVARIAIAAQGTGRYYELHRALMSSTGPMTEARALEIAAKLGLDSAQLKRSAGSDAAKSGLAKAKALAAKLNIEGTPMFLIGDRYISGVSDTFYTDLTHLVAEVRKEGCKVC